MKPTFLKDLGEYRRVLAERNALLRSGRGRDDAGRRKEHEVWEDRLAVAAARVHRERRGYSARLAAALAEPERVILPGAGELVVRFQPSPAESADDGGERFEELFRNALGRGRRRDQGMGFTAIGPHRDDIRVDLDGADLRRFGSGGQVRSAMIALSLAKLGLLRERRGESPLFLMDDFDSDLDEARTAALVEFLHAGRFQAVLTTAKEALVERLAARSVRIRLEGGEAAAF